MPTTINTYTRTNSASAKALRLFRDYPLSTFTVLACLFGWTPFTLAALGLVEGTPSNIPPVSSSPPSS